VKSIPTIAGASKFVVLWRIESRSKGIETLNLGVANCPSPPSGTENHRPIHHKSAGFTLVELLVTAGLICFLTLLIVPALARTKPNNKATECLNNLRQFNAAYSMYASDYQDRVPNNFGVNDILADIQSGTLANWANNGMTWNASGTSVYDQGNTNREWVANGVLGKYLADPLRVYKCPADTFLSPVQVSAGYSARLRSISMNSVLGRFTSGNDSTAQGLNGFFPQYLQYLKQTSVPKPGKTWLVLDEHPDSINDGYFINNPTGVSWTDIPASYHNGACGVAFADGHSELKRWQSRTSVIPVRFAYSQPPPFDQLGRLDYAWYLEHSGYVNASTGQPAFNY
jgi:prepilin-type processing-associated H-X9-DG protein